MIRLLLIILLISISFIRVTLAQPKPTPLVKTGSQSYYTTLLEGRLAFKEKRFDDAIRYLTTVVISNPKHLDSWNMLGTIYLKKRNFALAENAFEEVIDISPGYIPAYQGLAISQEALLKFEDALMNFQFFIRNFPGSEKDYAVFRTAQLLCRFDNYYESIPLYQELTKNVDSDFSEESSYYLKNIHANLARFKGHKKILTNIQHIMPQQNNCMPSSLTAVLTYWGEPTSLQELSSHLMDTQEGGFMIDMIDYVRKLGFNVVIKKGSFDDLMMWINKDIPVIVNQVLNKPDNSKVVHLRTIGGYDRVTESIYTSDTFQIPYTTFAKSWKEADNIMILIVPHNKRGLLGNNTVYDLEYIARADQFYARKDYTEAYQMYVEAEIENDSNIKALMGQAKSLIKLNKLNEAIAELKDITQIYPQNQEAYFLLGVIYFNNNDLDIALGYLAKCISINNNLFPEAHNFIGYIYIEHGNYNNGIRELYTSLKLKPNYMPAHYNLAKAYVQTGQFDKAINHLAICIEKLYISFEQVNANTSFQPLHNFKAYQKLKDL